MQPHPGPYQIPEQTAAVARAAFPKGSLAMRLADTLGLLYEQADFAALYSATGRPGEDPVRLALVSIFQFLEGLSDRQAADAVRGRIDWKYALRLELTDPGFDYSVLSEFRARLIAGAHEQILFDKVLAHLRAQGLRHPRAGGNGLTPRRCWARFAPSIGSNASERRCVMRSMCFPRLRHRGCWSTWTRRGHNGMKNASVISACPKKRRSGQS